MTQRRLEDDPAFEAILNCGICFTNMTRPKLLDCSHSFCQSCLEQWVNTLNAWQINCPLCNKLTEKAWRGITGLPDDFRLQQFLGCLRKANLDIYQHDRNVMKRRGNRDGTRIDGISEVREKDREDVGVDIRSKTGKTINTLRPRKMAAIFQTTFSNAFSSMKMYEFRLRLHWSLFLGVQLTIFHHWVR